MSDDCTTTKKCIRRDGESLLQVLSVNTRCHFNGLCGMNDGVRQCVCKEGYSGDGVNECKSMICIHIEYLVCWFAFRKNMKF